MKPLAGNKAGCKLQQPFAFTQPLIDQLQIKLFEITQPAMNQFGGLAAGTGCELLLFNEYGFITAGRDRLCNTAAVNTATDNQDIGIERLSVDASS